ncbi:MAG: 1-acyl-sn-glycerol-3-phosphate acyltransferase, partial [Pyrinomonadaceae bacterium]
AASILSQSKDAEVIHPDMNLEIDLGLDSLARAEFFAGLEQAFEAEFTADQVAAALTVRNAIDLIESTDAGSKIGDAADPDGAAISTDINWGKILRETDDDLPEVSAALRERTVFVALAFVVYRIFNLFCRGFMRLEVTGVEKAGAIGLKKGMVLNIYPEGERAFDGKLHEFKKGAAILATELDLPIVPVALDGLQNVWARKSWKIRPAKVKIKIGEPIFPRDILKSEETPDESRDAYTILIDEVRGRIEMMIADIRKGTDKTGNP